MIIRSMHFLIGQPSLSVKNAPYPYTNISPFAQSISNTLNFKLSIESSPQPQTLQDGLLHP